MEVYSVLIFAACFVSAQFAKGDYHYVLAPNVIRLDNDEHLLVGTLGNLKNEHVSVGFEFLGKAISVKGVVVPDAEHPVQVTIKVTANDIFENHGERFQGKPKTIIMVARATGWMQSRVIALSYKPGYLIVETDKPLYNPEQTIYVRVLAMDEYLKPMKNTQLEIDLIKLDFQTPEDITVGRVSVGNSLNGFYRGDFQLPPFPEFGTWTIKAKLGGKLETYAIAPIEVREFVVPTFGVTIASSRQYILNRSMDPLEVTVDAKYVYGKTVDGSAELDINIRKKGDISEPSTVVTMNRQKLQNGKAHFVIDIKELVKGHGGQFPAGALLELTSRVYESATGKEELGSDDSVMFVNCPFRFDLSRSKTTYRKGITYYMQIMMLHANGNPAGGERFNLGMYKNDILNETKTYNTTENGYYLAPIPTTFEDGARKFKVYTNGFEEYGTELIVHPYTSKHQIVVEKIERDGASFIEAKTDIQNGTQSTGVVIMVIARGQIVLNKYRPAALPVQLELDKSVIERLSPSARLFAFYVDKQNNEIVVDSSAVYVDPKCRTQLELNPEKLEVNPGESSKLTVTGPSGMWVGFNVIDKALLLLNSENILKENKVFQEMLAHDIGCGAGGGTTSEDIFKNAGLTILTEANVNANRIEMETVECVDNRRKRRAVIDTNGCYYGAKPICCEAGEQYAYDIINEYETANNPFNTDEPVPHTICYSRARDMATKHKETLPSKCPIAFYEACLMTMSAKLSESDAASGRSVFSNQDQYTRDVSILAGLGLSLKIRKNFETSFFFEEHVLSNNGYETNLKYRDSITEWSIQAIGISESNGACIAHPKYVKAFKDFFIQVDLPYKVSRKETFNIKVTVFNYLQNEQTARVYLKGVKDLCYGTTPGEQSQPQLAKLPPNSAKTLTFPMIPLEAGTYPITVSAFVLNENMPTADIVEKQLLVVNEGIQEKMNFTVCLDPNKQMENCINGPHVNSTERLHLAGSPSVKMRVEFPLPSFALPGTASANAYLRGNLMGQAVSCVLHGVGDMFHKPWGCGEQTMIATAPIVYGMYFLMQTGTMEAQHEQKGVEFMRYGLTRECSMYQLPDGSFHKWEGVPASLWLTAFVAKVMCQAEQVVKGTVAAQNLQRTLAYISNANSGGTGFFRDNQEIEIKSLQGVIGEGDWAADPSLTAFVVTSLQECTERTNAVQDSIHRAVTALETIPRTTRKNNPFLVAISTYALAFSNSSKKVEYRNELYAMRLEDRGRLYWSLDGKANAYAVETTAYALLAFLKFDDFKTSHKIVAWLTEQSDAIGIYWSTQDTVVALQALATYSARTYNPDLNMQVTIEKGGWRHTSHLHNDNSLLQILIPSLPVAYGDNVFVVTATGSGTGVLKIDMFYNRKAREEEICAFDISPIEIKDVNADIANNQNNQAINANRNCDVCGYCQEPDEGDVDYEMMGLRDKRQAISVPVTIQKCVQFTIRTKPNSTDAGMSIVQVNLETGVRVVESDILKMKKHDKIITLYEMPSDGKGFFVLYIDKITASPIEFTFRLEDAYSGNDTTRHPALIEVYDYYQPEHSCIIQYGIGSNHGKSLSISCTDKSDQCNCVQSKCIKPVDEELVEMALKVAREKDPKTKQKLSKPVDELLDYACNFEKASYVFRVTINEVGYNKENNRNFATATINEELLRGAVVNLVGDEIYFDWTVGCELPSLKKEHAYYVICKEERVVDEAGMKRWKYELMGTALVINPEYKPILGVVMKKFADTLKANKGCTN
ncbi:complement C5-like [Dreissena polymorpha]|uniref:complement C5-like n=1 Tax=Dreissena polymorpha TaxID=45954 RepID=UPI002263BE51|nr:complement C5-like [Dreissena polymorpha]